MEAEINCYLIEEMLQRRRTSDLFPKTTSLFHILQRSHQQIDEEDIRQLFISEKREVFELSYLYNSPHFTSSSVFRQLVNILESANNQAHSFHEANSLVGNENNPNRVKLACLKFIYRELLCIAVKSKQQIQQSQIVQKLKEWYYGLYDMHSFLQGVNIKKTGQGKNEVMEVNEIRSNYSSNVFDEIDDYFRRRIDYCSKKAQPEPEPKTNKFKKPETKSNCNLPLIDKLLYRREDERMREFREKQFEKTYLKAMSNHKNRMKQPILLKFRTKYNDPKQQYENKRCSQQNPLGFVTLPQNFYCRGSENVSPKRETNWRNRLKKTNVKENNRLSLSNINGINLIHNKFQ